MKLWYERFRRMLQHRVSLAFLWKIIWYPSFLKRWKVQNDAQSLGDSPSTLDTKLKWKLLQNSKIKSPLMQQNRKQNMCCMEKDFNFLEMRSKLETFVELSKELNSNIALLAYWQTCIILHVNITITTSRHLLLIIARILLLHGMGWWNLFQQNQSQWNYLFLHLLLRSCVVYEHIPPKGGNSMIFWLIKVNKECRQYTGCHVWSGTYTQFRSLCDNITGPVQDHMGNPVKGGTGQILCFSTANFSIQLNCTFHFIVIELTPSLWP